MSQYGGYLKEHAGGYAAELRGVQRAVARVQGELGRLGDENAYLVEYLLGQAGGGVGVNGNGNGNGDGKVNGKGDGNVDLMEVMMDGDQDGSVGKGSEGEGEEEWIGLD